MMAITVRRDKRSANTVTEGFIKNVLTGDGVEGYAFIPNENPDQLIFVSTGATKKFGIVPDKRSLTYLSAAKKNGDNGVAESTDEDPETGFYRMHKSESLTEQMNAARDESRLDRLRAKLFGPKKRTVYKSKIDAPDAEEEEAINRKSDADAASLYSLRTLADHSAPAHVSWAEDRVRDHEGHRRRNSKYGLHREDKYPGK